MGIFRGPNIVRDGLVLALDAGSERSYPGTGTTWYDLSGNGNNAQLESSPTFSNKHLNFNVSGAKARINSPVGGAGTTTAQIWYKRDEISSSTSWRTLLGADTANRHHLISQASSRELGVWDGSFRGFGYTPIADGLYHSYVIVYDNAATASLYVDSIFISTIAIVLNLATYPIGNIGNWNSSTYWAGNIDRVVLYNRSLTVDEIEQNYNAQKNRFKI